MSNAAGVSPPGTAEVVIRNTPPTCASADATAEAGALECRCLEPVDKDYDVNISTLCSWAVGGIAVEASGCRLEGGDVPPRGSPVECTLVLDDGEDESIAVTASVVVPDAPPVGGKATLSPDPATELDTLTCTATDAFDPDGDPIVWSYEWLVGDGVPFSANDTLTGAYFDKGDEVRCVATPGGGAALESNVVVIANTAPALESAAASPATAGRLEAFECVAAGYSDPDPADGEAVEFEWLLLPDDAVVGTGATFAPAGLAPGDVVRCRARPTDGTDFGAAVVSSPVTVIDYPPVVVQVEVGPENPTVADTLECTAETADPDGDPVATTWAWMRNSATITGATEGTLTGGFVRGDAIACVATPTTAFSDGEPVTSAPVEITNAPPKVTVAIDAGVWCAPVECTAAAEDPDGDEVALVVDTPEAGAPFQEVTCTATGDDGFDSTTATATATTLPSTTTAEAAIVTPPAPLVGETLMCAGQGLSDPCGPATVGEIVWMSSGLVIGEGPTLDTTSLTNGQTITCSLTPTAGPFSVGTTVASAPVVLQAPPPEAPIVTIEAPNGADGPVSCVAVTQPDPGLEIEYLLVVNGEPMGAPVAPADKVKHCDEVKCTSFVDVDGVALPSNTAVLVLPVGSDCTDPGLCSVAACAPSGGCGGTPKPGDCDDGDLCTESDSCTDGVCVGTALTCDDDNPCTYGSCIPGVGCYQFANKAACDDGSACTDGDGCAGGGCVPGPMLVCDDGNPCTADVCDPVSGCLSTPSSGLCDDGNPCTDGDQCSGGACGGAPVTSDGEPDAAVCGEAQYCLVGDCVANLPPTIPTVSVEPASPVSGDELECLVSGSVDPDGWPGAPLSYSVEWLVDGESVGPEPPATTFGAEITCVGRASDGVALSSAGSASVTVGNAPPTIVSVTVLPSLTCYVVATDGDDDPAALDVVTIWTVNGVELAPNAAPGANGCDLVKCRVIVSDGDLAATADSAPVVLPPDDDCGTNPCTEYDCHPTGGCTSSAKTGLCDDGDPCTELTTCQGQVCKGVPTTCDDDDTCTTDDCVEGLGCAFTANDSCDDGIACTADSCHPQLGCLYDGAPPAPPNDFALSSGIPVGQTGWIDPTDEYDTELVQGSQGGLHVDAAYRLTPPPGYAGSPLLTKIEATLSLGCCTDPVVSELNDDTWPSWLIAEGVYQGQFIFLMPKVDATLYEGQTACMTITASLYTDGDYSQPIAFTATKRQVYSLVDVF